MHLRSEKPPRTDFEHAVHRAVQAVPSGRVTTYRDVAVAVGRPGAARAVGNVMRCNPDTKRTPCHRVVRADGRVGGYNGGFDDADRKIAWLRREGVPIDGAGRIRDFPGRRFRFDDAADPPARGPNGPTRPS